MNVTIAHVAFFLCVSQEFFSRMGDPNATYRVQVRLEIDHLSDLSNFELFESLQICSG